MHPLYKISSLCDIFKDNPKLDLYASKSWKQELQDSSKTGRKRWKIINSSPLLESIFQAMIVPSEYIMCLPTMNCKLWSRQWTEFSYKPWKRGKRNDIHPSPACNAHLLSKMWCTTLETTTKSLCNAQRCHYTICRLDFIFKKSVHRLFLYSILYIVIWIFLNY